MFGFEGLFAKKAGSLDDPGMNGDEGAVAGHMVKIGGHEFMPGDPVSIKSFDAWVAKAKANGEMIEATDGSGAHYPLNSTIGKAELVKAELQIKMDLSPEQAQKAVDNIPGFKNPAPKPLIIYKAPGAESKAPGAESKVSGMEAKATGKEAKVSGMEAKATGKEAKATGKEGMAKQGDAKASYQRGPRTVPA